MPIPPSKTPTALGIETVPDGKIRDYIDDRLRNDTPEEYVRQNIERRIVKELKYPRERIEIDMWLVRWYREFRGGDLRLFHHHQRFQDVGASRAFRLNADQSVRVKIFGDFSLNLEYDLRFNTEPAPGRKELDQAFIFGVAYEIER